MGICYEAGHLCIMGDTVKLRGPPKAFTTKLISKGIGGRVNSPGYSKNVKDVTMGNPQPSPKDILMSMDAVQRLDGSGCSKIILLCLRYSLLSCESMSI